MNRKHVKALFSLCVAATLVLGTTLAASAATAKSTKDVTTGRTQQNVRTGVITYDAVTVPKYAEEVTLSGKVVIDGPKLVVNIKNNNTVIGIAEVQKVEDKTWTYKISIPLGNQIGDVNFVIEAYTIYQNGQPSPDVHTYANNVTQTVHVPYVKAFDYINLTWDAYHRNSNTFDLSYNLVKVWDDGEREVVQDRVNGSVEGTKSYSITATDKTHDNGAVTNVATIVPPVVVKEFAAGQGTFTDYNPENNTYKLTFILTSELSNGDKKVETITRYVDAEATYIYAAEYSTNVPEYSYSRNFTFTAPKAPEITVSDVSVVITGYETIAENELKNNYRVQYHVIITLSDGTKYTSGNLEITIPFNKGQETASKSEEKTFIIEGKSYVVDYTVTVNQAQ